MISRFIKQICGLLLLTGAASGEPLPPVVGKVHSLGVAAGENLYELGLRYGLAIEHLAFANGLPIQLNVSSARELKVPNRRILPQNPPENGLVVNLPERGVFLFRNGSFEKFYPVAIGQPGRFATPTGQFKLISLVKDPNWMPPEWAGLGEDTIVPAGPDNPLGDRWMGLSMPGLGLHSTTDPSSIGAAASHGCMRMYPSMARELFDKLQVGYPVRVEYEPVKVGRDSETGSLSLVAFPDVYNQRPLAARADELLARTGLQNLIDPLELQPWLDKPDGLPHSFAEGQIGLSLQGQDLGEPGLLLKTSRGLWISGEACRRLGIGLNFDASTKMLTLTANGRTASYSTSEGALVGDRLYLPARSTLEALGVTFHWDGPLRSLVIDQQIGPASN